MANGIKGVVMALAMATLLSGCETMGSAWDWTKGAASSTAEFVSSPFTDDEAEDM